MDNNQPLRVLIGTLCGGGMVTVQYLLSLIATLEHCRKVVPGKRRIEVGIYTLGNESLVSRGRDHCAWVAMAQQWDKLLFIDSDQGWTPEQFEVIVRSEKLIIGGVTPLKTLPIALNFLPKEEDEFYFKDRMRSYESLLAMRKGHGTPEINVGYIGTGYLAIDVRRVLLPLSQYAEPFRYPNPKTGQLTTHWQFFATRPINKRCLSEDWSFVNFARNHGIEPYINADVCVSHTGSFTFDARMGHNPNSEEVNAIQQRAVGKI